MWQASFWKGAAERAVKTFAQAFAVAAGLGEPGVSVFGLDWRAAAGLAAAAALASLLTSIGSDAVGPSGSPSLVDDRP